jgi:predicted regulator of amino acid metabolism with ACT domain
MQLTPDDKIKINELITKGLLIQEEISDLRGSLNDAIKQLADQIGCTPKVIKQALKVAKKGNLEEVQEETEYLEEVLRVAGRA